MHKDISQTTGERFQNKRLKKLKLIRNEFFVFLVPFIDTQPVESKVLKPLIGAGIYYKTTPGYGGFIGPLIILHDDELN